MLRLRTALPVRRGASAGRCPTPAKPLSDKKKPVADADSARRRRPTWNSSSDASPPARSTRTASRRSTSTTSRVGDKQRLQWTEQELMGFHLLWKPSYNLDVKDVPPPTLEAKVNVREANELYRAAMEYKGKGFGDDYVLNQRRAEMLLREMLEKYPNSDKIGDVAYQLGDIYESRAYRQYDRAAKYFERSFQWVKGSRTDARLAGRGPLRQAPQRAVRRRSSCTAT